MNTWLSAIMLVSAAAGFAVCAGGLVPRGRRHVDQKGTAAGSSPDGGGCSDGSGRLRVDVGMRRDDAHAERGGTPVTAVVGMAVMLVAMGDMVLDAVQLLPGVVWGLLMLLAGPLLLAGDRRASRPSHCGFGMHRSLSMIAMAALTIAGGHGHDAVATSEHAHTGSEVLPLLPILLAVGVGGLLAYTAVLALKHHRALHPQTPIRGRRMRALPRAVVESCLAAVSVAAMAGSMIT
ncbi:hypothetical protein ACX80H_12520 [Arthrobacter sp. MDT2-2]